MLVGDVILKTQQALKKTQHAVLRMQYEDILNLLIELRDEVEQFNAVAWRECNHNEFIMFTKLVGKSTEKEAEQDISDFLVRYEEELARCVSSSYPTERQRELEDGWDIRI